MKVPHRIGEFTGKTAFKLYDIRAERTIAESVRVSSTHDDCGPTVHRNCWMQEPVRLQELSPEPSRAPLAWEPQHSVPSSKAWLKGLGQVTGNLVRRRDSAWHAAGLVGDPRLPTRLSRFARLRSCRQFYRLARHNDLKP